MKNLKLCIAVVCMALFAAFPVSGATDGDASGGEVQPLSSNKSLIRVVLFDAISRNMGKSEAEALNNAIDAYLKDGIDGAKNSGAETLNGLIDKYVKGKDAQAALKDGVEKIKNGEGSKVDAVDIATKVSVGGVEAWIDKQKDWSDKQKADAKAVLQATAANGIDGLTDSAGEILKEKLTEAIGAENARAAVDAAKSFFSEGKIDSEAALGIVSSIAKDVLIDKVNGQLGKMVEKYPLLGELFKDLGIDGKGVVGAITQIGGILGGDGSIAEKLAQLASLSMKTLNELLGKLAQFAIGKMMALLNQLGEWAKKAIANLVDLLKKAIDKAKEKIKDWLKKLDDLLGKLKETTTYVLEKAKEIDTKVQDAVNKVQGLRRALE